MNISCYQIIDLMFWFSHVKENSLTNGISFISQFYISDFQNLA